MKEQRVDDTNQSIYCYPGTSILINNYDIKDKEKLLELENAIVTYKLAKIICDEQPFSKNLSIDHYFNIHKYLFEDIYPFAGKIREEMTNKKNTEIKGEEGIRIYCAPKHIYECLNERLTLMKKEARNIYTREGLINFLAKNYLELYYIHPFREGNSRTLREFMREYVEIINEKLIRFGNFKIDYSKLNNIDRENFIRAVIWNTSDNIEKQEKSIELLKNCFDICLVEYELVNRKSR